MVFSYTELEIEVPDIGIVGLHAENLGIESVLVDGDPTEFEYYPHNQGTDSEKRFASNVSSPISAADAAAAAYITALEIELIPNLLINCCNKMQIEQINMETNGVQSSAEVKQVTVAVFRVNYNVLNLKIVFFSACKCWRIYRFNPCIRACFVPFLVLHAKPKQKQ